VYSMEPSGHLVVTSTKCWPRGWMRIDGPQRALTDGFKLTSRPAQIWPARPGNSAEICAKS
jgi:hypothetical protein